MEEENEVDKSSTFLKNLLHFLKIILIIISIICIYLLINGVQSNPKKATRIKNNIINITNNSTNNSIIENNQIICNNNTSGDIYPKINELKNFVEYEYVFFNSFKLFKALRKFYFSIQYMNYYISKKFNLVKLEYSISIYDKNNQLLLPSELTLFYDFHFSCFMEVEKNKTMIHSLAYISQNKYLICIEYFYLDEKVKFGLKIYSGKLFYQLIFYTKDIINYDDINHINNDVFDQDIISDNFKNLVDEIKSNYMNRPYSLKKAYLRKPIFDLRRNLIRPNSPWLFRNFYSTYYCYCVGYDCFKVKSFQTCKYLYYIYIIDIDRDLYPKTDFIFVDFIFKSLSSDDTYPVFQEMIKQNYPAHYITEKEDIYEQYCGNNTQCTTIMPINDATYFKYGDFFEKYLDLVLKTKAFISCKEKHFHRVGYLFYRIEYTTYIAVGHGVCYFKDYLFNKNRIYGINRNNKIIIPPSEILISTAINHGWKKENIIQLNLPRWDRFNYQEKEHEIYEGFKSNITNNSILVMFTWRMSMKFNSYLSPFYTKNLTKLLKNEDLERELSLNNITLYLSFHRYLREMNQVLIKKIMKNNKNIVIIEQNELAECLAKSSLVVSDFSSVMFDFMYRRKPIIIYVPDSNDPKIKEFYTDDYVSLIERMNNKTFLVENKCNTVEETVDKIIFYIKNNFKIDNKLSNFYKNFNFTVDNNIEKFITYLEKLE